MLKAGDHIPFDAIVWIRPRETVRIGELVAAQAVLLLFYLFDWSST